MADTYRATLAKNPEGTWRLFVVLPGRVSDWPTHEFGTAEIPTIGARDEALNALGYGIADPDGWTWCEDDDQTGAVVLMAGTKVRPIGPPSRAHA